MKRNGSDKLAYNWRDLLLSLVLSVLVAAWDAEYDRRNGIYIVCSWH